jgi:hypothetical protein
METQFQRAKTTEESEELAREEALAWAKRIETQGARPLSAAEMAKGVLGRYRPRKAASR